MHRTVTPGAQEGITLGFSPGQSVVMRVGGPQAPSPPSPGRLSCTRTLYPVFGRRFINVTFSLGSTGSRVHSIHCSVPTSSRRCFSPFSSSAQAPPPAPDVSPLTHNGGPGHGPRAVLGPVVQADRSNGSISREGDQWGYHKLAALLGQKPRSSQGHRGHCQETQSKAWPRKPTSPSET